MDRQSILNLIGHFTWDFGQRFFIETSKGNFVWSDPAYEGDNVLRAVRCSYKEWIGSSFGRDKGTYFIGAYCGTDVKIVGLNNEDI